MEKVSFCFETDIRQEVWLRLLFARSSNVERLLAFHIFFNKIKYHCVVCPFFSLRRFHFRLRLGEPIAFRIDNSSANFTGIRRGTNESHIFYSCLTFSVHVNSKKFSEFGNRAASCAAIASVKLYDFIIFVGTIRILYGRCLL